MTYLHLDISNMIRGPPVETLQITHLQNSFFPNVVELDSLGIKKMAVQVMNSLVMMTPESPDSNGQWSVL